MLNQFYDGSQHKWIPTICIDGIRICQAELVNELSYMIFQTDVRPEQKTDRDGGFGSTGKE